MNHSNLRLRESATVASSTHEDGFFPGASAMRRWAALASSIALLAVSSSAFAATLPRSSLTPGAVDARVTQAMILQTICTRGYHASVRKVSTSTKSKVYAEYHVKKRDEGKYVIDHLVPLEVGGASVLANLWPELKKEANAKDKIERTIRARVCAGQVDLTTAQRAFTADWRTAPETATTTTTSTTTTTTEPATTEPPQASDYQPETPVETTRPEHSPFVPAPPASVPYLPPGGLTTPPQPITNPVYPTPTYSPGP